MVNKAVLALLGILAASATASAQCVKDFVEVDGARANKLIGYGVVTGLNGNGDSPKEESARILHNLLQNLQPTDVAVQNINARNAALVLVTAELQPFQKKGTRMDVTVSAVGDTKTLFGGELQLVDLRGPRGRQEDPSIYALASGRVVVQGEARKGNHTTGTVPGGAIVEKELDHTFVTDAVVRIGGQNQRRKAFKLVLKKPDLTMASQLAMQINRAYVTPEGHRFELALAAALDGGSIAVRIPTVEEYRAATGTAPEVDYEQEPVRWMERVLNFPVSFSMVETACVVINDATKTISWTGEVKLREGSVMVFDAKGGRPSLFPAGEGQLLSEFMDNVKKVATEQQVVDVVRALHGVGLIKAEVKSQ